MVRPPEGTLYAQITFEGVPMTADQDRFAVEGKRPRTKEELEEMLKSPQFRSEMMDGFAEIERGNYISYPIDEIKRRLRFDK